MWDAGAERQRLTEFVRRNATGETTVVAVQGLGFVGAAMVAALAEARTPAGVPRFAVIGVDLPGEAGRDKIAHVRHGLPPLWSKDARLSEAYARAAATGNLTATVSHAAYELAGVVVVDVNLDVRKSPSGDPRDYEVGYDAYLRALRSVAGAIAEDTLVVIETTVPPGTTEKIIRPLFATAFAGRGLDARRLRLAHSYERVTPGCRYLDSITDFYRVFAGIDRTSAERARAFLEAFVNTRDYPLSELPSVTASEMAKVLENAYRAANIAFMQEWTTFAEAAEVDLFGVIDAIRVRPTHRNMMAPGFGVGGYCLPKDALLADWALRSHFGAAGRLDVSLEAIRINDSMPLHTFALLEQSAGRLEGHRVALLGVAYVDGVADTRGSPSATFYDQCVAAGALVTPHDPMVSFWPEKRIRVRRTLQPFARARHDTLVFAVRHPEYLSLTAGDIVRSFPGITCVIDANDVLSDGVADGIRTHGIRVLGVGKGHWRAAGRLAARQPA